MAHVFISYKSEEADFAIEVQRALEARNISVWRDKERLEAGEDWREDIDQAIREAFAMIVIVSQKSIASRYIVYEFGYAFGQNMKVIPILFDVSEGFLKSFHPRFEGRQAFKSENGTWNWDKLAMRLNKIQSSFRSRTAVSNAMEDLDSSDPNIRKQGLEALASLKAIDQFVLVTSHDYPDVRYAAAFYIADLTNFGDDRALAPLAYVLVNAGYSDVQKAAKFLQKYGEKAIPFVEQGLAAEYSEARYEAVKVLGQLKATNSAKVIIPLLDDVHHYKVVHAALDSLKAIGDKSVVTDLRDRLTISDPTTRLHLARTLVSLGDLTVYPVIIELLINNNFDNRLSTTITNLLVFIGSPCVPMLLQHMKSVDKYKLLQLFEILGKIGDERAIEAIASYLSNEDDEIRWYAINSLGMIRDPSIYDRLLSILNNASENDDFRIKALWALGQIGCPKCIETLLSYMESYDPVIRIQAMLAIAEFTKEEYSSEILTQLRRETVEIQRPTMEKILRDLGTEEAMRFADSLRNRR